MKTYIINLESSVRRRANVLREAQRRRLDYEIVTAVDGRQFSSDDLERLPIADVVRNSFAYYSPNIIATALSHAKVYERILANDTPVALVLEDDAVLCEDFSLVLEGIEANIRSSEIVACHYMSFQTLELSKVDREDLASGYGLYYPIRLEGVNSGAAYVITRKAAATLLKVVIPVQAEADAWETFYRQGGFESIRFVHPMPVTARGDKSTIASARQSGLRYRLTSAIDTYRIPPFYQALRAARLRSIASRSRVELVDRSGEIQENSKRP